MASARASKRSQKTIKPVLIDHFNTTYGQLRRLVTALGCTVKERKWERGHLPLRLYVIKHPGIPEWAHFFRYAPDREKVPPVLMAALENDLDHHYIIRTHQVCWWLDARRVARNRS